MVGPPPIGRDGTVIIVIATITVAVVMIIAASFVIFSGLDEPGYINGEATPRANLNFLENPETSGEYLGTFDSSVRLDILDIRVYDHSRDESIILSLDNETFAQIQGGLNITYTNANTNGKLDMADLILIQGGAPGDTITIIYIPTGGTVAKTTLT